MQEKGQFRQEGAKLEGRGHKARGARQSPPLPPEPSEKTILLCGRLICGSFLGPPQETSGSTCLLGAALSGQGRLGTGELLFLGQVGDHMGKCTWKAPCACVCMHVYVYTCVCVNIFSEMHFEELAHVTEMAVKAKLCRAGRRAGNSSKN